MNIPNKRLMTLTAVALIANGIAAALEKIRAMAPPDT
jgi:hypothetical protein